jgi:hypothetical protein
MFLKVGSRLRATNSRCEVIVVKAPTAEVDLICGGFPMVTDPVESSGTNSLPGTVQIELGKRYASEEVNIEVLCTKSGGGPLECNGHELVRLGAKALPASD